VPKADAETVRKRVVVAGRVQGVGYRASCASQARALGVAGTVRNRPDGRVEAVFEGATPAVDALVAWCERGPAYAHVDGLQVFDEPPRGETGFRIT
jgi:acylphosphatase